MTGRGGEEERGEGERGDNKNRKEAGDIKKGRKKFFILELMTRIESETRILYRRDPYGIGEEVS